MPVFEPRGRLWKEPDEGGKYHIANVSPGSFNKAGDWLRSPWERLPERYKSQRIGFHFHILASLKRVPRVHGYLCAVVEYAGLPPCGREDLLPRREVHIDPKLGDGDLTDDNIDRPVLVSVREFPYEPQKVGVRILPSVIRLQLLDHCYCPWVRTRQAIRAELSPGLRGITVDRKGSAVARRPTVRDDELPSQIVEAGAEILDAVSKYCGQPRRRRCHDFKEVPAFIVVILKVESAEIRLFEPIPALSIERTEMFLGPIELKSDAFKRVTHAPRALEHRRETE